MTVSAGRGGTGSRILPKIDMPMDDYLMLLGMYLSEGHSYSSKKNGDYYIEITQIKSENRARMIKMLQQANIEFAEVCYGTKVRIIGKQIQKHFSRFGLSYKKYIPQELFKLQPQQLRILYEWLMWGDGCRTGSSHSYCTTSPQLADDVQKLLLHIGMSGKITKTEVGTMEIMGRICKCRPRYDISVTRTKLTPTINHGHTNEQGGQLERYVEYTGEVYCVELSKNHTLYTRHNGKVHWSGNSARHGNKGIVVDIIPDHEMPFVKDKDGNHVPLEVLLSPSGIPTRINIG